MMRLRWSLTSATKDGTHAFTYSYRCLPEADLEEFVLEPPSPRLPDR
jgi:hypothetical protein